MPIEREGGSLVLNGERVSVELEQFIEREDARIRELAEKATSQATRRAYSSDWSSFCGWCGSRGFLPLPATPDVVARYVRWLIDRPTRVVEDDYIRSDHAEPIKRRRIQTQASPATVSRHLVSIRKAHLAANLDDPTSSLLVATVWSGIRRERGRPPKQKAYLDNTLLKRALNARDDLHFAPSTMSERDCLAFNLRETRDRAIILLGWSGAFRRSEIAGIDFEHLRFQEQGVEIVLPRSKRNQDGQLESVLIGFASDQNFCPVEALNNWLNLTSEQTGPVFLTIDRHGNLGNRIQPAVVASITKSFANAAGLNAQDFAGHSLRSGWITTAARSDRHERDIMRHSRHKSIPVMRGYIREAMKWSSHPGSGLL